MRGRAAASSIVCLALALPSFSGAVSVTMPVNDSMGGPVTISVGDVQAPSRETPQRTERYDRPSSSSDGGGDSPDDGAWLLAALVAAPVVIVGGAFYVAGVAVSDWLRNWQTERERRRQDEAERARLEEEDRKRAEALGAEFAAQASAGRETLYDALTALLDAASSEAAAEEPFPYRASDVVTSIGGSVAARENLYNAAILDAYRRLWADPRNRALLKLIDPRQFKAILAHEAGFRADIFKHCAKLVVRCRKNGQMKPAAKIGVGIAAIIRDTGTRTLGLRIDDQVDERLDPSKSLEAGLRLLIVYHQQIVHIYQKRRAAPNPTFLWELTVLSYNTSPYNFENAIEAASNERSVPFQNIRLTDLMSSKDGKPSTLEKYVGRNKFNNEASSYLDGVRRMLPKNDPRRGGQ